MQLDVTFRNLSPRPEVKARAELLFSKLDKFLDTAAEGHLVMSVEHGKVVVEIVVASRGHTFKAVEEHDELRNALDSAFHTVENQLRRFKDRGADQRERGPDHEFASEEASA